MLGLLLGADGTRAPRERPRASKTVMTSSLPPGEVAKSMSSVHSSADEIDLFGEFALGRGERFLAGDVEQARPELPDAQSDGCRYWLMSSTRSFSSSASTATAPG